MSSRTTSLILITVLCASLFALYEAFRVPDSPELNQSEAALTGKKSPTTETVWPVVTSAPEQATSTPQTNAAPNYATQNQIQALRQQMSLQANALAVLRGQQQQQLRALNEVNPQLIGQRRDEIQNLSDLLVNSRLSENDLNQISRNAINEQSRAESFYRDQLDLNIQNVSENIRQIQSLLGGNRPAEILTQEQKQDYDSGLQNNLILLNQQLQALREQRVDLSAQMANQLGAVTASVASQKSDLLEDQAAIQGQIFNLRDELRSLQWSNNQVRMSLIPLSQQIDQAQKDYLALQNQVSALENQQPQESR